jgi:hypothetical protein
MDMADLKAFMNEPGWMDLGWMEFSLDGKG